MSTSNTASKAPCMESSYIDLQMMGLGYLSCVRTVAVRRGPPFTSVSIRAMCGQKKVEGMEYTPIDALAISEQSHAVLCQIEEAANDQTKRVMAQFKVGGVYIDTTFTHKSGRPGVMLKARLLLIDHAWVKDISKGNDQEGWKLVYERPNQVAPPRKVQNSSPAPIADLSG